MTSMPRAATSVHIRNLTSPFFGGVCVCLCEGVMGEMRSEGYMCESLCVCLCAGWVVCMYMYVCECVSGEGVRV